MTVTIAIDPGKVKAGVALAVSGTVIGAATIGAKPHQMAPALMSWVKAVLPNRPIDHVTLVYEVMRDYPGKRARAQDLEDLRQMVADTQECFRDAFLPFPRSLMGVSAHAWKGNVPKPVHHARLCAALTVHERRSWGTMGHDARDAVGLLLYALGRTERGGVPPQ